MQESFNLLDVLRIWLKWKKTILIVVIISGIASVIVSLLLPNYYRAEALFYPTNPSMTSRQTLFTTQTVSASIQFFGSKDDINRMITVAESGPLIDFMVNYYHLADHYDIDTSSKYWRFKTKEEFMGNYDVVKTDLGAIQISLLDKDPKLAAEMVNMIVQKVDETNSQLLISNNAEITVSFKDKLAQKQKQVKNITDSLAALKQQYDIETIITSEGKEVAVNSSDVQQTEIYNILRQSLSNELEQLKDLSNLYTQYDVTSQQEVSSVFMLQKAFAPEKKSKPIRWLICVTTVLVTLIVMLMGSLVIEQGRKVSEQL